MLLHAGADLATSSRKPRPTINAAAEAQQIVAEDRPSSVNSLSTLAIYTLLHLRLRSGRQSARRKRRQLANTKFERENLDKQLDEYETNATTNSRNSRSESRKRTESGRRQSARKPRKPARPALGGGGLGE